MLSRSLKRTGNSTPCYSSFVSRTPILRRFTVLRSFLSSSDCKRQTKDHPTSRDMSDQGSDSPSHSESRSSSLSQNNHNHKRRRFNDKNGSRRRRAWDAPKEENDTGDSVAPGSFAHESLRAMFHVTLPDNVSLTQTHGATTATEPSTGRNLASKKKVAMLVGYQGTNYAGFQMNAQQRTVQAELELALLKAELLSASNFGYPFKYNWSTSGRTDKGVHACAQVCAAKLHIGDIEGGSEDKAPAEPLLLDSVVKRVNQHLPADIRVLHMVRTTRAFCAKNMRAHVRYQYMVPSYCLHPDLKQVFQDHGIVWDPKTRQARDPLTEDQIQQVQNTLRGYRVTPEQLHRLQEALTALEGTHSFHHFTKSVDASDAKATRYIVSYQCLPPVVFANGVEWIPTQVLGQSFLVYQVRKMTSLVLDVARGVAPLSVVEAALRKDSKVRLNVAPAQGLFKEMSYYQGYNQRKGQSNPELADLVWDEEGSEVEKRWRTFKEHVVHHIVEDEDQHGNFVKYMFNQEFIFDMRTHYQLER